MRECGFEEDVISRVQYLIAHHHTYQGIDGQDYQILVEADFLVNLYEDGASEKAVRTAGEKIFRTAAGTDILKKMFRISD
ncbi:MAG: phosphohydrolase, partial [Lachnospiraceae bacterium]|nr:phosphohydrolase [Lachnospiraceae bacterium]